MTFNGVQCIDVDECNLGIHKCIKTTTCKNTEISNTSEHDQTGYTCDCLSQTIPCITESLLVRSFELKNECFTGSFRSFKDLLNAESITQVNENRVK